MQKISTLFVRDPEDLRRITREVHPACEWVMAGEGAPTRKYDGTCVMYDGERWWARREVKPGKAFPPGWQQVQHEGTTGKSVGWEPIEQSAFARFVAQALATPFEGVTAMWMPGTYELIGPKVNGNPERRDAHKLWPHGFMTLEDAAELLSLDLTFDGIRDWLATHSDWEGIVWHHPDGRMAKIKRRDFQ